MSMKRWQGLRALVGDAVEHGATAIERVHLETARRPFTIMEQIPPLAEPAQNIREVHDTIVSGVYASVRLVNQVRGQDTRCGARGARGRGTARRLGARTALSP